jgi:hypothetical protein
MAMAQAVEREIPAMQWTSRWAPCPTPSPKSSTLRICSFLGGWKFGSSSSMSSKITEWTLARGNTSGIKRMRSTVVSEGCQIETMWVNRLRSSPPNSKIPQMVKAKGGTNGCFRDLDASMARIIP